MEPVGLPDDPKTYYIQNKVTIAELAELYKTYPKCSKPHLYHRSQQERWRELRYLYNCAMAEKAADGKLAADTEEFNNAISQMPLEAYLKVVLSLQAKILMALDHSEKAQRPLIQKDDGMINPLTRLVLADALSLLATLHKNKDQPRPYRFGGVPMDVDHV